jgi:hypothetical protein
MKSTHLPRRGAKFSFVAKFLTDPQNGLPPQAVFLAAYLQDHGYRWMHHHSHLCDLLDINRTTLRKYLKQLCEAGVVKIITYHWTGIHRHLVARCPRTMLAWMAEREAGGLSVNTTFRDFLTNFVEQVGEDIVVFKRQSDPTPWVDMENGVGGMMIEQLERSDPILIARARKYHFAVPAGILHSFQITLWSKYIVLRMLSAKCFTWDCHKTAAQRLHIPLKTWKNTISELREYGLVSGHNYTSDAKARGDNYEQACFRKGDYALALSKEGALTNWQLRVAAGLSVVEGPDTIWLWDNLFTRELGEGKKAFHQQIKKQTRSSRSVPAPNVDSGTESPGRETCINPQERKPLSFPGERRSDSLSSLPVNGWRGAAMQDFAARTRELACYLTDRLPGAVSTLAKRVTETLTTAPVQQPLVSEAARDAFPGVAYWLRMTRPRLRMLDKFAAGEELTERQWGEYTAMHDEAVSLADVQAGGRSVRRVWEAAHLGNKWAAPKALPRYYDGKPAVRAFFAEDTLGAAFLRCFDMPLAACDDAVLGRLYRKMMRGVINADHVARLSWVQGSHMRINLPSLERVSVMSKLEVLLWAKQIAIAELRTTNSIRAVYAEAVTVGSGDRVLEMIL